MGCSSSALEGASTNLRAVPRLDSWARSPRVSKESPCNDSDQWIWMMVTVLSWIVLAICAEIRWPLCWVSFRLGSSVGLGRCVSGVVDQTQYYGAHYAAIGQRDTKIKSLEDLGIFFASRKGTSFMRLSESQCKKRSCLTGVWTPASTLREMSSTCIQ